MKASVAMAGSSRLVAAGTVFSLASAMALYQVTSLVLTTGAVRQIPISLQIGTPYAPAISLPVQVRLGLSLASVRSLEQVPAYAVAALERGGIAAHHSSPASTLPKGGGLPAPSGNASPLPAPAASLGETSSSEDPHGAAGKPAAHRIDVQLPASSQARS
jgi:hypothetical protein